jgi:hypothetical protein
MPFAALRTNPVRLEFDPADDVRMTDNTYPHSGQVSHTAAPRDTFLTAAEVAARYRWGRTKMAKMRVSPGFPVSLHGSFRLDTLLDWEERVLAGGVDPSRVVPAPRAAASADGPPPPTSKRPGRRRAAQEVAQ